ncbi:PfkB family carbohydrate kinase [Microbacterium thalassium]|uniref:PfkB family carbohydrate kinase n=1 Tax=Microbacterium TaxID=33882 RepID=UPI00146E6BA6|nr:PfkB family carbohydrate kinase [Microbacterium thalassium]
MTAETALDIDVLVIGEALMDIVIKGSQSVEAPGGSPSNVALGLGRRGVDVALLTKLGSDPRGSTITRHLEGSGVWVLAESFGSGPTSAAYAHILGDGSARYDFRIDWTLSRERLGVKPRTVHTGSIAAFLAPGADIVLQHIDRLGPEIVTFDPNIRPALVGDPNSARARFQEFARQCTVLKLSDEDAEFLYPGMDQAGVIRAISDLGPRLIAFTRGADGAALAADGHLVEVPGPKVAVADTIGAGDTFMAALLADYPPLHNAELTEQRVRTLALRATEAAAVTVGRPGADLPWAAELAPDAHSSP